MFSFFSKKNLCTVILPAVAGSCFIVTPVQAGSDDEVWNVGLEMYNHYLRQGKVVCEGDEDKKKHYACSHLIYGGRMLSTTVVAREQGLTENINALVTFYLDEHLNFRLDANGRPITVVGHVSGSPNAASTWNAGLAQIPGATLNGFGAAALSAAFPQNYGGTYVLQGGSAYAGAASDARIDVRFGRFNPDCPTGDC